MDKRHSKDFPTQRKPAIKPLRPASERIPGLARPDSEATRQVRPLAPPAPPVPPAAPAESGLYVPWWGFALVILAVAGITCALWGFVLMSRGDPASGVGPTPTPIFVVITSTPTLGAAPEESPTLPTGTQPTAQVVPPTIELPELTPTATQAIPLAIGSRVVIAGTEGDGLAIRQGPGLSYSYFFVGNDGDVFTVEDGPRDADGYVWWYITDPNDPNRAGWAAETYLVALQPGS